MSSRFHTPDPLAPGEYVLAGPEAHHLVAVRRFAPGDRIVLFNGDGIEYPAEIVSTGRRQVVLNVLRAEAVSRELLFELIVAAAMPKGDRGDFLIEKLVESGATRFVPLMTERTVVQPKESRLGKLQQTVIEASKQCGRNVLMTVDELTKWTAFASQHATGLTLILHPDGQPLQSFGRGGTRIAIAVGPEGGFTEEEVSAGEACGWRRASLGPRILRVETAAIAAAAWFALQ